MRIIMIPSKHFAGYQYFHKHLIRLLLVHKLIPLMKALKKDTPR